MFKTRKYGSILMLIILSISYVCLTLDAYCESSDAIVQCQSVSDSLMVDDIDFDCVDGLISPIMRHNVNCECFRICPTESIASDYVKAKMSDELKLGLVRRYLPQDDNSSWVNSVFMFPIKIKNNGIDLKTSLAVIFFV